MYPDKSVMYAFQRLYEPMKGLDNTWLVNFFEGGEWKQHSFISLDGAMVFFYTKVNEYKAQYQQMFSQKSK